MKRRVEAGEGLTALVDQLVSLILVRPVEALLLPLRPRHLADELLNIRPHLVLVPQLKDALVAPFGSDVTHANLRHTTPHEFRRCIEVYLGIPSARCAKLAAHKASETLYGLIDESLT